MPLFRKRKGPTVSVQGRTIILVGHCGPDMFMLRGAVKRFVRDAEVVTVNDAASLKYHLTPNKLLLVNRELDGEFDTASGIELIRSVTAGDDAPKAILISNYPEAQAEAVEAGAAPGFGKSALYDDATREILAGAMDDEQRAEAS